MNEQRNQVRAQTETERERTATERANARLRAAEAGQAEATGPGHVGQSLYTPYRTFRNVMEGLREEQRRNPGGGSELQQHFPQ